jgi:hypothetical protein
VTGAHERTRLRCLLLLILLAVAPRGLAADPTLQDLVAGGHLQLNARLQHPGTLVPGQKLTMVIEIATDRWFSGGTRFSLPEVPGLVILQTEQFAANASERRGDSSWVLQRWTLDVYPQRAGEFTIPPITARLKVNAGEGGEVAGALKSPPLAFTVTLPPALAAVAQWVAAPEFSVSQSFDRSLEGLRVGDAFEREIVFEAGDVMAMMLPTFTEKELPGLAAYPAPPVLDNSNNRGQTRASRRQRISYVVQAEGHYQLPTADFFWWDTGQGELKMLSLPATGITVGAGAPGTFAAAGAPRVTPRQLLLGGACLVLLASLLWLVRRYLPRGLAARAIAALAAVPQKVHALRQPALPERLNPGSSAGQRKAYGSR